MPIGLTTLQITWSRGWGRAAVCISSASNDLLVVPGGGNSVGIRVGALLPAESRGPRDSLPEISVRTLIARRGRPTLVLSTASPGVWAGSLHLLSPTHTLLVLPSAGNSVWVVCHRRVRKPRQWSWPRGWRAGWRGRSRRRRLPDGASVRVAAPCRPARAEASATPGEKQES